jgi:hypothetical protein
VPGPCVPAPSAQQLAALALVLTDGLHLEPGDPPCLVRIRNVDEPDGDVEIGVKALDPGDHPLCGLIGLEADEDWAAVGVAGTGRLHHLDDSGGPERVRTTHLVACDGSWAVRWQPLDGGDAFEGAGRPGDRDMPVGRVDDALRRCLGLDTAPPEGSTARLWVLLWLDAVVSMAGSTRGRRRLRCWQAVAELHPAVPALVADLTEPVPPARLVELGDALTRLRDWTEVRRMVASGSLVLPEVDAVAAAWLDDGSFSRWALGGFPSAHELARAATSLLSPDLTGSICDVLSALSR